MLKRFDVLLNEIHESVHDWENKPMMVSASQVVLAGSLSMDEITIFITNLQEKFGNWGEL